jgi:hypothetical protein
MFNKQLKGNMTNEANFLTHYNVSVSCGQL